MYSVVIVAAGSGSRCELGYNKLLYKINNLTLLEICTKKFNDGEVILVSNEKDYETFSALFPNFKIVLGGSTRQESVTNGVKEATYENVLVHDGARIFVNEETISNVINTLETAVAVVPCVKVKDSIKDSDGKNIDRSNLYIAQTPQGIKKSLYLENVNEECTDDVSVLEKSGYDVKIVEGSYDNIKITTIDDIKYAEYLLGGKNDL